MRDSSLRERGQRRYSMATHGASTQEATYGNYVLKPGVASLRKPAFALGGTTLRILPVRSPEDPGVWDPFRFSLEPNDFGEWIRRYPAVRGAGTGEMSVTFITHDPAVEGSSLDAVEQTPGWVLYRAISQAVRQGQEGQGWAATLLGGPGRRAALPKPSEIYLVQCVIVQNKGKPYTPPLGFEPESKLVVCELSTSAGQAMLQEFSRVDPEYQGAGGDDFENMMLCGDPISLDTGRFVTFYRLEDGPPGAQVPAAGGWDAGAGARDASDKAEYGYGCCVEKQFGTMAARLTEYEPTVAAKSRPWSELLEFPTIEEQAALLASNFPADMIMYAFQDHPTWIPEQVRRRATASQQVAMGGFGRPAGAGQGGGVASPAVPSAPDAVPPQAAPGWGVPPQEAPPQEAPAYVAPPQEAPAYVAPPQVAPPQVAPPQVAPPQVAAGWGAPPTATPTAPVASVPDAPVAPVVAAPATVAAPVAQDPAVPAGVIPTTPVVPAPVVPVAPPAGAPTGTPVAPVAPVGPPADAHAPVAEPTTPAVESSSQAALRRAREMAGRR